MVREGWWNGLPCEFERVTAIHGGKDTRVIRVRMDPRVIFYVDAEWWEVLLEEYGWVQKPQTIKVDLVW